MSANFRQSVSAFVILFECAKNALWRECKYIMNANRTTLVFGHKNPDTDSVAAAIALARLKNKLGEDAVPVTLGEINKESQFVLDYFDIERPPVIENVKTQVKDLNYDLVEGITPDTSILNAYKIMESKDLRTLPVVDKAGGLLGIIAMKDIAMELVRGDFYKLNTSLKNIVSDLNAKIIVDGDASVSGNIAVVAYYYKTALDCLSKDDIIIVGDRYDIIECAINRQVKLIIVTDGKIPPLKYVTMAEEKQVPIVTVPLDAYTTAKLINQCNYVSSIMRDKGVVKFNHNQYLDEVKEEMLNTNYRNYPVVNDQNILLGMINKQHLLKPAKKQVILVDHNEYSQSAEGLHEAEIKEIIDHHKIGDVATNAPVYFRNMPVGSTCTIIYQLYKESNVELDRSTAGVLLAGIVSDTLLFKSPTTTEQDKKVAAELQAMLNLSVEKFAMEMFKVGTSLEGSSIEEIFYKDFKEFHLDRYKAGIAQVFTLDIDSVFARKEQFLNFINQTHNNKEYYLTLLLVTDILKQGSYLLFQTNNSSLISSAFNVPANQGVFVSGLVSRKKQVVPKIAEVVSLI